jgi:hypothetical protein
MDEGATLAKDKEKRHLPFGLSCLVAGCFATTRAQQITTSSQGKSDSKGSFF